MKRLQLVCKANIHYTIQISDFNAEIYSKQYEADLTGMDIMEAEVKEKAQHKKLYLMNSFLQKKANQNMHEQSQNL